MGSRVVLAAVFFAAATIVAGALGRWTPSAPGPIAALVLAALGVLLIKLAPAAPATPDAGSGGDDPIAPPVLHEERANVES